eukprot:gene26503-35166_t
MDNQNLPSDWSACNDAISSDFANSNIFWFSNDSILSDGQCDNFERMNDVESLQAGLERDLQEYINDCVFTDSAPGHLEYYPTNDPATTTTKHNATGDSSNNAPNYSSSVLNINSSSALQYQSLSKPLSRKKNSPSSSTQSQAKVPSKEKQTMKISAPSKAGTAVPTIKDMVVKAEESDDDKSSVDSEDGKDDSFHISKSRSSSIDERGGGSDNDTSKRKFPTKKVDAQNAREKNREHAKNTRMRKKNYIESLKENIKQLTDEREQSDLKRKASLSKLADQTILRKKVLQQMFFFRSIGELDPAKWNSILDESFTLVMPITPYRSFPPSEVIEGQRHIKGIQAVILDTASFTLMIQSIATVHEDGENIMVQYYSGPNESVMAENIFMCKWHMTTINAVRKGSRYEISKHGMAKAVFSAQNKLMFVELSFDVMSFMQQLRRSSGKFDFLVIPNTPALAMEESSEARMITEADKPHRITYVNQSFVELFGYVPEQVVGYTCFILQGAETEQDHINALMNNVNRNLPCSSKITNYTKDNQKFKNWIRIYPLYVEGRVSHFLGVLERIADRYSMYRLSNTAATSAATAVTSAFITAGAMPGLPHNLPHPNPSSGLSQGDPASGVLKSSIDFGINVTDSQLQHVMSAPQHVSPSSSSAASSTGAPAKDGESESSQSGKTNSSSGSKSLPLPRRATSRGKVKSGNAHSIAHSLGNFAGPIANINVLERTNQSNPPYYSHPLTTAQVNYGESGLQKSSSNSSSRDSGGSMSGSGGTSRESQSNFDSSAAGGNFNERGSESKNDVNSGGLALSGSSSSTVNLLLRNTSNASINSIISVSSELKFSTNASDIVIGDDVFGDMTFDEDLLYPLTD